MRRVQRATGHTCESSQVPSRGVGDSTELKQLPLFRPVGDGEDDGHTGQQHWQPTGKQQSAEEDVQHLQTA